MKFVADTNTLVSGFLWDGLPSRFLDAGLTGRCSLYTSDELLVELDETLHAPKFSERLSSRDHSAESLVRKFRQACHEIPRHLLWSRRICAMQTICTFWPALSPCPWI